MVNKFLNVDEAHNFYRVLQRFVYRGLQCICSRGLQYFSCILEYLYFMQSLNALLLVIAKG
jgi:hypothetical protein